MTNVTNEHFKPEGASLDKNAILARVNELVNGSDIESAWKLVASYCVENRNDAEMLAALREIERARMRSEPSGARLSFAYIVLNGMPFLEHSLKSIYDFAHEIIIVEGAVENCMFAANEDGSSTDGTIEFIRSFPDPDNKIKLVQGEWPEKCEMTNEAVRYVTGDYIWLMASDEVYRAQDIEKISELLKADSSITQVDLIPYNFWKGFDYVMDCPRFLDEHLQFQGPIKFLKGARFINHRPLQLKYPGYLLTADYIHRIDGKETREADIRLFHYSYVLESQVYQKIELYRRYGWGKSWDLDLEQWYNECFLKWTPENRERVEAEYPVWTGDRNSRTVPFTGEHPKVIHEFISEFRRNDCPGQHHDPAGMPNDTRKDEDVTVTSSQQILEQVARFSKTASVEKLIQGRVAIRINSAQFTLQRLGTEYGGWVVPVNRISEDSICYCVGAGEDVSFDVELVKKYGCNVHTFDPTPRAQAHISTLKDSTHKGLKVGIDGSESEFYDVQAEQVDKIRFFPYGIWSHSGIQKFYAPANPIHVSHSILNIQKTQDHFNAECLSLVDAMKRLGHDRIDMLKLDVEGAEYEIVDSIIRDKIPIGIICLEFDELNCAIDEHFEQRIRQCIDKLLNADFVPLFIGGGGCSNYTFVSGHMVRSESHTLAPKSKVTNPIEEIFRRPRYIKTETTNICNANCSFCAYDLMTRPKGVMSMDLFETVVNQYVAMGGGQITISPEVGDCLVDARLIERLRYCRQFEQITELGFHTNMIALDRWTDEQVLEIIDLVTWWACSIGPNRDVYKDMFGVDQFERVVANLERLHRLIGRCRNKPDIELNGRACGDAFAVDERLARLAYALIKEPIKWMRVYGDWGGKLSELPRNTPVEKAEGESKKQLPCMKPLVSAVVFNDGKVGFCGCADYNAELVIGDIKKETLESILGGRKRRQYLESFGTPKLNDYCRKCTFYEPLQNDLVPLWNRHQSQSALSHGTDSDQVREPARREPGEQGRSMHQTYLSQTRQFWPEDETLPVVGRPAYQQMVVDSWKYINLDEPLQKRSALMGRNVEQQTPFWNNHVALSFLAANLNPDSYLEIGVRSGGSLIPTVHNCDIKTVVCVDMWEGSYGGIPNSMEYTREQISRYKERTGSSFEVEFFKGDSHTVLKKLIASGRKFDLITVDGDHSEQGAWKDLNDVSLLLADSGAIVFDDIIHSSHKYLMGVAERYAREHPEYRVLINSTQDNGCVVFLKGIDPATLLSCGRDRIVDRIADSGRQSVVRQVENTDRRLSSSDSVFGLCKCVKSEETVSAISSPYKETTANAVQARSGDCVQEAKVRSLLWVRTDSIGDNILSMSMLPHIHTKYPNARITVLCQEHIAELYEVCPHVDNIITFNRIMALKDEKCRCQIVDRVRAIEPDLALNSVFSREPLTDIFSIGSLAKQRIALHGDLCNISREARQMYNRHYTELLRSEGEHRLELQRHADFLKGLGVNAKDLDPTVWTTSQDEQFADEFFRSNNLNSGDTVALFPTAQHFHKVYEEYDRVIDGLQSRGLSFIILGGSDKDTQLNAGRLRSKLSSISYDLVGKTTIRQMAAIIRRCCLYLGSDSSGAHIACAVGTPNVVLLGGGHFGRFLPYSPLTSVVCLPLECYECLWGCQYERTHCVKDIAPEVVVEAVHRTLEERSDKAKVFVQDSSLWNRKLGRPAWRSCDGLLNLDNAEIVRVGAERAYRATPNSHTEHVLELGSCTYGDKSRSLSASCSLGACNQSPPADRPLAIATSIAPKNIDGQKIAIESWLKLGFEVASINHTGDIEFLRSSFPRVKFVETERSAESEFGRTFVYLDDILGYLQQSGAEVCGIVNSDIVLSGDPSLIRFIRDCAKDSMVYGPRIDVDSMDSLCGETYSSGFDFFFFPASIISYFPRSVFCLGLPWWDYWLPLISALNSICIKQLDSPFAYHFKHNTNWGAQHWEFLAREFFAFLRDGIEENYHANASDNPWSLLGRMFAAYHDHYLESRNIIDRTKMSLGIIPPCILNFLDKKSIKISYNGSGFASGPAAMVSSSKRGPTAIPLGSLQESINVPSSNDVDVSIVICTRDRAKLLDRMLSSLEDSARRVAYEVIAVEGGSCDNTVEVLRKHHVTQIYNEAQCLGQGRHSWPQLYNFGFSKARGKWAMYASDDIVFGQGCIDRAVEYLNRQKDEVAGGIFFYRNLHATDPQWSEYGIDFTYGPRLLMNYGLVRLDRFMEVGGLDEAYEFYCADSDLCYKLYETSKHLIPLANCFVDHNNILDARKSCNMAAADKDIQRLLHKWRNYVTSDLPRPRRLIWTQDVEDALRLSDELEEMGSCIENYWHGLACLEQGLFQDAREEFARVTDSGISHWRVWWYLAKSVRKCQEIEFCKESTSFVL